MRAPSRSDAVAERRDVRVAVDRCGGCCECLRVCTAGALDLMPDVSAVLPDPARCTGCRRCVEACPARAIRVSGPVRGRHRVVLDAVHDALARACPPGWRVVAAEPVLPPDPAAAGAPDVAVLRLPLAGTEWLPAGPPVELVVEVVSPGSRARDLGSRREHYHRLGVPSYWTVEQDSGLVAVQWCHPGRWFDPWAHTLFA
jgi:NAD-dependent dihydropyrimidine dehydrogenase PreA subunit